MTRRGHIHSESGQSAVEFALVLPLLIGVLLAIVEFGIVFSNYVTLTDAARVGARKAITIRLGGTTPQDATQAVRDAAGSLNQGNLQVTVTDSDWTAAGSQITVKASYPYSIDIPLLGISIASGTMTSQAEERLE